MSIEIKVPSPGESISEVSVSKWLVNIGDYVELDQPIAEFESDKATFEVNATTNGKIESLIGAEGDTITVGAVIAIVDEKAIGEPKKKEATSIVKEEIKANVEKPVEKQIEIKKPIDHTLLISPIALELLTERGIDPSSVQGTGANGKITKIDALEAIVNTGVIVKSHTYATREQRREKMSNLRKTVSRRLVAAKNETAMLTTFNEVNMKPIMDLRSKFKEDFLKKHEIGLGFMSFFIRACSLALKKWPAVNAMLDGEEMVFNDYCDISIAVSAPKGLVVPVIRNAETLTLAEIEKQVKILATKARDNKITIEEMTGGTFTITNGGVFGSMMSTPIVNPPQSGILGMHNIVERPVVENGQIVIRPIMYVALSYDHRIIDGRESVSFLVEVKNLLENPERLLDGKSPVLKVLGL